MRRMIRRLCVLALLALGNLPSSPAQAQSSPPAEASALIDRGIDLRVDKRDAEALELFEKAHALSPSPRALAQIGLAEQALGRWVAAETHLVAALAAADDPWIGKARPVLEDGLRVVRTHLGSVQIEANVAGAEVLVNGLVVATTPMTKPARVPAASAAITVRAKGYVPVEVRRNVTADDLVRETVTLVAEPSPVAPGPSATAPAAPSSSPDAAPASPTLDVAPSSSRRTWGFVAGGVGVASLAATGVLAYMATSKTGDLPQTCQDAPNQGCTPSQGDDINAARRYAGIANVTFGVGLAGVGLGTWLLLSSPSQSDKTGHVRVVPAASVGYGGVNVGGAF